MIEFGKLYKIDSNPLEAVVEKVSGEIYCNEDGHAIRYISDDEYEFIKQTPLVASEIISGLSPAVLDLFWKLHKYDPFKKK